MRGDRAVRAVGAWVGLVGRPPRERVALVRAFVAKAVLGLSEASALAERLSADALLRRLCGFSLRWRGALSECMFSQQSQPARMHEALVRSQLDDALIGHVSRDSAAIETHEKPVNVEPAPAAAQGRNPAQDHSP